jgi:hypothetical protein
MKPPGVVVITPTEYLGLWAATQIPDRSAVGSAVVLRFGALALHDV